MSSGDDATQDGPRLLSRLVWALDRAALLLARRGAKSPWALFGWLAALTLLVPLAILWATDERVHDRMALTALLVLGSFSPMVLVGALGARAQSVLHRYSEAQTRGDLDEMLRLRKVLDGDRPPRDAFERAVRLLGDAEMLCACGRWAEAREAYDRIDLDALPEDSRPGASGMRGLVTAYAGAPELGLARIDEAIAASKRVEGYSPGRSWCLRMRRATALTLAERHEEAVALIEDLFSDDAEDAEVWTEAVLSMALSAHAVGAIDDALHLVERAATSGTGYFARQARIVLDLVRAAPFDPDALEKALATVYGRASTTRE